MAEWTLEQVADRFREAAQTAERLPRAHVQGYFNGWPEIRREGWEAYATPDKRLRCPPTPQAVDRLLETTRWLQGIPEEQRHLVWMCAQGHRWHHICAWLGCDRTTAWRRWKAALASVARQLNDRVF